MRGELDWLVMRALEKDRDRRYESASALAADLERYLSDEPVEAGPPSAAYRLRKYVRRNRRALGTVGIVAAALVVATGVSAWQAVIAREAQHQAEADRDRAKKAEDRSAAEAAIAGVVSDFLQKDLIGQAPSAPELGQDSRGEVYLTVKEALDKATARVGQRFQDQPLVEAAILTTIGTAYNNLSANPFAIAPLERAVALRKHHLGPGHSDTLTSMSNLANACRWVGRHEDSIALCQHVLEQRRIQLGPNHQEVLRCEYRLGEAYVVSGKWDIGERLLKNLIVKQSTQLGPAHLDILDTKTWLALLYEHWEGRVSEAIQLYEEVRDQRALAQGKTHPDTVTSIFWLAQAYQGAGRLDESERLLREVLDIRRNQPKSVGGATNTANIHGWLARALLLQQRFAEAEPLAREAVKLLEAYDPSTVRHYEWMSVLGDALLGQQRYDAAEPLLLKGYDGIKRVDVNPKLIHVRLAEAGERLVRLYETTNQPDKAQQWREKVALHKAAR
jgi:tetratricopeptide (TPR) repeat protein